MSMQMIFPQMMTPSEISKGKSDIEMPEIPVFGPKHRMQNLPLSSDDYPSASKIDIFESEVFDDCHSEQSIGTMRPQIVNDSIQKMAKYGDGSSSIQGLESRSEQSATGMEATGLDATGLDKSTSEARIPTDEEMISNYTAINRAPPK